MHALNDATQALGPTLDFLQPHHAGLESLSLSFGTQKMHHYEVTACLPGCRACSSLVLTTPQVQTNQGLSGLGQQTARDACRISCT